MADNDRSITVKVLENSDKLLVDQLEKWKIETRMTAADVLKEEAALTARAAMQFTPPVDGKSGGQGDKKVAERWGNFAVKFDVLQVIGYENKALASAAGPKGSSAKFAKWRERKRPIKPGIIQKIYDDENFGRAYNKAKALMSKNYKLAIFTTTAEIQHEHNIQRGKYKGRIRRNMSKGVKMQQMPALSNPKLLDAYIEQRQRKVGYLKAGWFDVINKIGPPKINGIAKNFGVKDLPGFITRHAGNGHGGVQMELQITGNSDQFIHITNGIGNIFKIAYENNVVSQVYNVRSKKSAKRMAHFQRAINAKFNGTKVTTSKRYDLDI